jgi:hypothetical protein
VVSAQGGQFSSEAEVTFGQKIQFSLVAKTDLPIKNITLFMRPLASETPLSVDVPFTQVDGDITASYALETQPVKLAPFTAVQYSWQITTEAGEIIPVPAQTVTYQDDRFEWQHLVADEPGTAVSIFWTGDDLEPGQVAHEMVQESVTRLNSLLPIAPHTPLPIFLYPSSADLRSALRLNGHDWTLGHVDPALGVVMVTAVNPKTARNDLDRPLPHEVTHFWLYQAAGSHYDTMPHWFKEGLAVWLEGGDHTAEAALLATAVAEKRTIPLAELCTTFTMEQSPMATAQSGSLVAFVQAKYGERVLGDLAAAFVNGADCDTAVATLFHQSVAEFEADWLRAQQPQTAVAQFLTRNGLWLLLCAGGFAIMGLLITRSRTAPAGLPNPGESRKGAERVVMPTTNHKQLEESK